MPWYYAGPEAKPVGPVTLDELHACRLRGIVKPETYVIEHTGQPSENWAWKHYQDIFPSSPGQPPLPPFPSTPAMTPAPPVHAPAIPSPVMAPHPLFPSAAPVSNRQPVFPPGARPDPYYQVKPTNGWCAWGFGFALAGLFFSLACGIGLLLALPSFFICIVGLTQVHKNRGQAGQGLAVAGLILSGIALVISLIFIISVSIPILKAHGLTVTEQTSNDSE
jgi:hypothetical protein